MSKNNCVTSPEFKEVFKWKCRHFKRKMHLKYHKLSEDLV